MKSLARWLPAIVTLMFLAVALLAPVRRVGAGSGPVTDAVFNPSCDLLLEQNGSSATYSFGGTGGVTQPFSFSGNVAACSLTFDLPYYSAGVVNIKKWNAATLMPDPSTIALRTSGYGPSAWQWSRTVSFDPPLVLRESPDVAEAIGADLAIEFKNLYNPEVIHYDPDGASGLPVARQFASDPNAPQSPLPGSHPVLDHRICGGNGVLQDYLVTQSVVRSDSVLGSAALYEVAQHFRVPVLTRLHWIEFVADMFGEFGYGVLAVYEGNGEDVAPITWPTALISANFLGTGLTSWGTHFDFDSVPTLRPDHDYWLVMRTFGKYKFEVRRKDGTEPVTYTQNIGSLQIRPTSTNPWTLLPKLTLDFRTIGEASSAVSVDPPAMMPGALRLAVTPTPSRGAVAVSWTGARGAVRFDVIDPRGRRVAGGDVAAAAVGRWTWNATGADGRALPAGVYFMRARDGAAHTATQRVVLVR